MPNKLVKRYRLIFRDEICEQRRYASIIGIKLFYETGMIFLGKRDNAYSKALCKFFGNAVKFLVFVIDIISSII